MLNTIMKMYSDEDEMLDQLYTSFARCKTLVQFVHSQKQDGVYGSNVDVLFLCVVHRINIRSVGNYLYGFTEFNSHGALSQLSQKYSRTRRYQLFGYTIMSTGPRMFLTMNKMTIAQCSPLLITHRIRYRCIKVSADLRL